VRLTLALSSAYGLGIGIGRKAKVVLETTRSLISNKGHVDSSKSLAAILLANLKNHGFLFDHIESIP